MLWIHSCYSRLLIDNHITDQKPEFMRYFSPANYAAMVRLSGVESAMVYACDHNGNCYYPTRIGHMHSGLNGRDVFGETIHLLNNDGIIPVAYYTVIYHNRSALEHPEWRMRNINGAESSGRYHFCCPNNAEYQEFARRQIEEVISYPVKGLFIDMTFWPLVCTCNACRKAFRREYGKEIPERIDWRNPVWVRFQRWREKSMASFGAMLTGHVKSLRPELTVAHQFSPVLHGWFLGQSSAIAQASDYSSGDFYGGKKQQRIGTKIFASYSKHLPYEFMTSRCTDLHDHTSTKSDDELFLHAVSTLANGGAFLFIDAINPDGTLNRQFYERLHRIVEKLKPYRSLIKRHRPELSGNVGLYFSMTSCINEALDGVLLQEDTTHGMNMDERENAVVSETVETAYLLNTLHVPYRIVTDLTTDYSSIDTLIINNAAYLSGSECKRIRAFVRNGGTLLATGKTSLYSETGESSGNFQLADVFGVFFTGKECGPVSYLHLGADDLSVRGVCTPFVEAKEETTVRGTVFLPDFPPHDPEHYASIHSDPPGINSGFAGLTVHSFGKGRCVYLAPALFKQAEHSQQKFGKELLKEFVRPFVVASENLPDCVELTLLRSRTQKALLLGIVNVQEELPVIPLHDLRLSIRLPDGFEVSEILDQNGEAYSFTSCCGILTFTLTRLHEAVFLELKEKMNSPV